MSSVKAELGCARKAKLFLNHGGLSLAAAIPAVRRPEKAKLAQSLPRHLGTPSECLGYATQCMCLAGVLGRRG